MARRSERRSLWGITPGSLHAVLNEQQKAAQHRIQALQSELDAERAEQERLEGELEAAQAAERLNQMKTGLALAAARLEDDQT